MKSKITLLIGIGLGLSLGTLFVSADLSIRQDITDGISYIRKLIFTTDGLPTSQSKVVIDGTDGSITSSGNVRGQQVCIGSDCRSTWPAGITSETDPNVNSLGKATLTCSNGQIAKYNGTTWICATDNGITSETDPSVNSLGKATLTCSNGQIAKYNGSAWVCATDNSGLSGFTETDPVWTADKTNYYTKTNQQTSGQAQIHYGNLTNVPGASTTTTGDVRLENSTGSTSTTLAATANIVNQMWTSLLAMINTKISGTGSNNYLARFNGTGNILSSIIYDNGTNVGIGTNNPQSIFHVVGNVIFAGLLNMQDNRITNLAAPIASTDAANKEYVDAAVVSAAGSNSSSAGVYLNNGEYYSVGGDPFYCKMFKLGDGKQFIKAINYRKQCDVSGNKYCNKNAECSTTLDPLVFDAGPWLHKCILYGNDVLCWGRNNDGQLGNGTTADKTTPTKVISLDAPTGVFNGQYMSCAILKDLGKVKCWGRSASGLGDGNYNSSTPVFVNNVYNAINIVMNHNKGYSHTTHSVNAGYDSSNDYKYNSICILKSDGTIVCWGDDTFGQLGRGQWNTSTTGPGTNVVGIANASGVYLSDYSYTSNYGWTGKPFACALLGDTKVKCWGNNEFGQLGRPSTHAASTYFNDPVPDFVLDENGSPLSGVVELDLEGTHACARLSNGTLKCWGGQNYDNTNSIRNYYHQLGQYGNAYLQSSNNYQLVPTPVNLPAATSGYFPEKLGESNSCVVRNGAARCWGNRSYIGLSSSPALITPVFVDGSAMGGNNNITDISMGRQVNCLTRSGSKYCWGDNSSWGLYGQNHNNTFSNPQGGTSNNKSSLGYNHSCFLNGGVVSCVGYNYYGQLGNGTTSDSPTSMVMVNGGALPANNSITAITVGSNYFSCALRSGVVYCWGYNGAGQLGNGSSSNSSNPVLVSNGSMTNSGVDSIYANGNLACALKGGSAYCWGSTSNYSSSTPSTIPVGAMGSNSSITDISIGSSHVCFLKSGEVYCMGDNSSGKLGDGTTTGRSSFVKVINFGSFTNSNIIDIAAGYYHTCAMKSDYSVYCWGNNDSQQLGTTSTPKVVVKSDNAPLTNVTSFDTAGYFYNHGNTRGSENQGCAVVNERVFCWGYGFNNYAAEVSDTVGAMTVKMNSAGGNNGLGTSTCALMGASYGGRVKCWGFNNYGQLGNGNTTTYWSTPQSVMNVDGATQIYMGSLETCAMVGSELRCWGYNGYGQLGIGTTTTVSTPTVVKNLPDNFAIYNTAESEKAMSVSSGTPTFCATLNAYNGNLGGLDGANSICQTECGAGYKFAYMTDMANFPGTIFGSERMRAHTNVSSYNCNNWTLSTNTTTYYVRYFTTSPGYWDVSTTSCDQTNRLACVRGVR